MLQRSWRDAVGRFRCTTAGSSQLGCVDIHLPNYSIAPSQATFYLVTNLFFELSASNINDQDKKIMSSKLIYLSQKFKGPLGGFMDGLLVSEGKRRTRTRMNKVPRKI